MDCPTIWQVSPNIIIKCPLLHRITIVCYSTNLCYICNVTYQLFVKQNVEERTFKSHNTKTTLLTNGSRIFGISLKNRITKPPLFTTQRYVYNLGGRGFKSQGHQVFYKICQIYPSLINLSSLILFTLYKSVLSDYHKKFNKKLFWIGQDSNTRPLVMICLQSKFSF